MKFHPGDITRWTDWPSYDLISYVGGNTYYIMDREYSDRNSTGHGIEVYEENSILITDVFRK